MRVVIYVKLDIVYSSNKQLNETISQKSYFFETVKSKVIISLFETVRLSVSISPRNLYNSLKSIKEQCFFHTKQGVLMLNLYDSLTVSQPGVAKISHIGCVG